jgi:hypothetical protein
MQNTNNRIDLGDELLAEIVKVVQNSDLPVHRKIKSLLRAGKIGEMYVGVMSDECGDTAFTSPDSSASPDSLVEK